MPRLPKKEREERDAKILADWKVGYSQRQIALEYDVSNAIVNKICKGVPQENVNIVNAQVAIKTELTQKTNHEVNSIETKVNEMTKHLEFFTNSALRNQKLANKVLEKKAEAKGDKAINFYDLESHSRITAKNKDTIVGKEPKVNINNEQSQKATTVVEIVEDKNNA